MGCCMIENEYLCSIESKVIDDYKSADKFTLKLILLQWLLISTLGGYFFDMYLFGFLSGAFLFFISFISYKYLLGTDLLRIINALILMSFSIILIQQSLGRIEMHFHIFIVLSFLLVYKDIKPILAAALFIIGHHLLFTYAQLNQIYLFDIPIVVFNYGCGYDIAFLHAFFVLLEMSILMRLASVNKQKMYTEIEDKHRIGILNENLKRNEAEIKAINKDLENKIEEATKKNRIKDKLIIEQSNEAQEKLRKSVERFGKHVIASKTDKRGIITEVTQSFCDISGYNKEELIGKPHNIVRHPDESKEKYKQMWRTIKSEKEWRGELKNVKKNGEIYWVDVSINTSYDDDGKVTGYESVRHDITSSKIKDEFMANMSHELRTPLNSIMGFSGILSKKNMIDEDRKLVEYINSSANFLLNLINDILDLAKIKDSKFTISPYEFHAYNEMNEFYNQFEGLVTNKTLVFHKEISDDLKSIFYGDLSRINQIILNITSNSIKFTPDKGEITFRAQYQNFQLILSIKDNGIGMNKETQDKIFKPFVQADGTTTRKYGGTGLGLSITQGLVEAMRGRLEIESKENVGTTIRVMLPLQKLDDNKLSKIEEVKEEYTFEPLNIHLLVVEDNKTNQILIKMLLEEFEITCDIANDGLEAISMYDTQIHKLILMDENMPIMNFMKL